MRWVLAARPAGRVSGREEAQALEGGAAGAACMQAAGAAPAAVDLTASAESVARCAAAGLDAKAALEARIGQAPVVCEVKNKDLYGRSVAVCEVAGARGGNLNAFMVESGNAVAYRCGWGGGTQGPHALKERWFTGLLCAPCNRGCLHPWGEHLHGVVPATARTSRCARR